MTTNQFLIINEPNVIHDTIDGETIVLNLNTGNYFSLDGLGALIWEAIRQESDWQSLIRLMVDANPGLSPQMEQSLEGFVETLIQEELLVPAEDKDCPGLTDEMIIDLMNAALKFTPPSLNKYSDMQELLLLDPIHDSNEKGWPESREITEEK